MLSFLRNFFHRQHLELVSAGKTDTGLLRSKNEDAFAILPAQRLYIVADGMGGHNAGEVASSTTVKIIGEHFKSASLPTLRGNPQEIRYTLTRSFEKANTIVTTMAAEKREWQGMGSTLVVAYFDDSTLHICHVGDTRCYIMTSGSLRQLTTDHTTLMEMRRGFSDTGELIEYLQNRHMVTRVIGYPFPEPPEYNSCQLKKGDRILLCTDGLWSVIDEKTISEVISTAATPFETVTRLIDLANQAGGPDNITGVVIFC